jgi:two-component system, chemotaxis family, protein-glutamate methylesterase/glutaminase
MARRLSGVEPDASGDEVRRDLVVIGASAGGVEALRRVVAVLPPDLQAAVCVVLHVAASTPSALAGILARAGALPCRPAQDHDPLTPGQILVAPPDRHLVVENDHACVTVGPRENNHRPSVDVLFRSAAEERRERVVGVVLSGMRDDGTAGLALIKDAGGVAFVQDPKDALHPGMPSSAIAHVAVDGVMRCEDLAEAIVRATGRDRPPATPLERPPAIPGKELQIVCPECGGVLSETIEAGVPRWECHVGHLYSPNSLNVAQSVEVERALWTSARMLRDRAALLRRLADHSQSRQYVRSEAKFREQASETERQADALMRMLDVSGRTALDAPDAPGADEEVA